VTAPLLDAYLARIGHAGPLRRDARTLSEIHRAHISAIPYDALDVQLGRQKALAEEAFFENLVRRRRGGWCYEMNGLLTRVLRELGFSVTRVAGAVARDSLGEQAVGNHLVGLVDLDRRWVADVGLADGPLDPFPLEERSWSEGRLEFRLERLQDGWWRFHNHVHGLARSFDFTEEPRELAWYQDMCSALQTQDFSPFVQYAIASRRSATGYEAVRDTTHFQVVDGALTKRDLSDVTDYRRVLASILGVDLGEDVATLWRTIEPRAAERARRAAEAAGAAPPVPGERLD
jgi:N-hydroxyarylamine O-acetyltransferase